jgi:hypothetical protein
VATAQVPRPGDGHDEPVGDIELTEDDRFELVDGISEAFGERAAADRLLMMIRFPRANWPNFERDMTQGWNQVFTDLDNGILPRPYRTILLAALRVYAGQPRLRSLAERHGLVPPGRPQAVPEPVRPASPEQAPQDATPPPESCHVIIRANNEDERQHAVRRLRELELEPAEVWSTGTAVSYRLTVGDPGAVRARLEQTDLGWTVVAPGEPDYLYQRLYVEGPDARRYVVRDAPAQQTFGNLATEILTDHYAQSEGTSVPITVDHVTQKGEVQRVDGDSTMHDAGVQDGDTLRFGHQTNAGSVHPDQHRAALARARNQLRAFARSHPGFHVRANASQFPTEYELRFRQPSLGPGPWEGADPVPIEDHVVLVVLGPEFPRQAPTLWWETPIFHPNVAPNYGDGQRRPQLAGKVCLGLLADEWQPGRDFGELCQMVIDMAAFRSYGIFRETHDPAGRPVFAGDFYDERAAAWVWHNQEHIRAMGGQVKMAGPRRRVEYPNVIEPLP